MPTIPLRELRNSVSSILRRAESGERFTVTVDGRAVAEVGPLSGTRAPASPEALASVIRGAPVDGAWTADAQRLRREDAAATRDPWAE